MTSTVFINLPPPLPAAAVINEALINDAVKSTPSAAMLSQQSVSHIQ